MAHEVDWSPWQGRVDAAEGRLARRWHEVVRPLEAGCAPGAAFLGLASDIGVRRNQGRPGAAEGPAALRRALANLPARADLRLYDAGTVTPDGEDLEGAQAEYGRRVAGLLEAGHLPVGLGGGHEIAWAQFPLRQAAPSAVATLARPAVEVSETDGRVEIVGEEFAIAFDRGTGLMTDWEVGSMPMVEAGPKGNFWRAPTDNDTAAGMWILRHLSRISDHVLNLAEKIAFIATGISPLTMKKKGKKDTVNTRTINLGM